MPLFDVEGRLECMEQLTMENVVSPPWGHTAILTASGLREARDYFFNTHAKHAHLIAEGRGAKGFMKSAARRKLNREMGEDFKMFTGTDLGKDDGSEESKGIRGELNQIFSTIRKKIAPKASISTALEEDLILLSHPLGAIEVVFGITAYYSELTRRYASLTSDRRKVLRGVLDEELFKWLWRLYYTLILGHVKNPPNFHDNIPSIGLKYIPREKERLTTSDKLVEIGKFLLSKVMTGSHLRFPISFYFVSYLRSVQIQTLLTTDRLVLEKLFDRLRKHKEEDSTDDPIIAIDVLMNIKGNSMQSFDDVLKQEDQDIRRFIPAEEAIFLAGYQEYGKAKLPETVKKLLPKGDDPDDESSSSLMPLMMLLRTLPVGLGQRILSVIPGPSLNLMKNRLTFGEMDESSRSLLDRVEEKIQQRHNRGEKYNIYSKKGTVAMQSVHVDQIKPEERLRETQAGKMAQNAVAGIQSSGFRATENQEDIEKTRQQAKAIKEQVIITWKATDTGISAISISPEEIMELTGVDGRFLMPWIIYSMQTRQVFNPPQNQITKEHLNKVLRTLTSNPKAPKDSNLTDDEKIELLEQSKGMSPQKALVNLVKRFGVGRQGNAAGGGTISKGIRSLTDRLGAETATFLSDPTREEFQFVLQKLSDEEKYTVSVLRRVARAEAN